MEKNNDKKDKMSRKKFLIIVCSFYLVFYIVCKLGLLLALFKIYADAPLVCPHTLGGEQDGEQTR